MEKGVILIPAIGIGHLFPPGKALDLCWQPGLLTSIKQCVASAVGNRLSLCSGRHSLLGGTLS